MTSAGRISYAISSDIKNSNIMFSTFEFLIILCASTSTKFLFNTNGSFITYVLLLEIFLFKE